jgi:MarR family
MLRNPLTCPCRRPHTQNVPCIASPIPAYVECRRDNGTVLRILAPIFDVVLADGVTPVIRATVNAVPVEREVSQAELASIQNLPKQTVSYRVTRAVKDGWLVNNEQRPGHPSKLVRGTPLPEERSALPTVAKVMEESNCPTGFRSIEDTPLPPVGGTCSWCGQIGAGCKFYPDEGQWVCSRMFDGPAFA